MGCHSLAERIHILIMRTKRLFFDVVSTLHGVFLQPWVDGSYHCKNQQAWHFVRPPGFAY